jgi:hypothetical protein
MSRRQHFFINERNQTKIYHLMDYKIHRPFFLEPLKITIGNPLNETYYMIKNIVYREKQILALKRDEEQNTIILVEAKIEDGKLTYISMLTDDVLMDVSEIIENYIQ